MAPTAIAIFSLGSPRVDGDEEEDDVDDLENEFQIVGRVRGNYLRETEEELHDRINSGPSNDEDSPPRHQFRPMETQFPSTLR